MPLIVLVAYALRRLAGQPLPDLRFPDALLLVSFVLFFVAAVGEELGWQGYASEALQVRFGALESALLVGVVWAAWHIIPFFEAHHTVDWVV